MALFLLQRLTAYLRPLIFLAIGLYGMHSQSTLPAKASSLSTTGALLVLLEIVTFQSQPKDVLDSTKLRDRIFGKLWLRVGMACRPHAKCPHRAPPWGNLLTDAPDSAVAAVDAMTGVPELIAKAHGTVLELGPGSGTQLPRYDVSKIERVYGVEPNVDLHDALRGNVKKHGLSDMYTIVPCVIEDFDKLKEYGIEAESVDTVTSVQVLCSVPEPEALARGLYKLLKPGGQMLVYEHVKSEDYVSRFVQCNF